MIQEYNSFSRFTSTNNKKEDIKKYLLEPEVLGKANLIHSIFKRQALKETIDAYFVRRVWGGDMCFNLAFLVRFNWIATDEILYRVGIDKATTPDLTHPQKNIFPLKESISYIYNNYLASRGTPYQWLVLWTMFSRLPQVIWNAIDVRIIRKI